jgi:hypothetical protein
MFFVWCVPLKSYLTFSTVLRNLAVNLPLKQTFVSLTPAMTPSLSVYYCTLCVVMRCAHFELSSVMIRFSCAEIRPQKFKLEIPIDLPKMRVFWRITPYGMRRIDETPKMLGRNRVD